MAEEQQQWYACFENHGRREPDAGPFPSESAAQSWLDQTQAFMRDGADLLLGPGAYSRGLEEGKIRFWTEAR